MNAIPGATCWICEKDPATTGEHILKASDIAMLYPNISEQPAYLRIQEEGTVRRIFSKKNDHLKFEKSLCATCNGVLTQPHDYARDHFVRVLLEHTRNAKYGGIRISTLFPRDPAAGMVNVQLFFAKLLGCTIVSTETPLDTRPLARCIRDGTAVPDLWITVSSHQQGRSRSAARGPLSAIMSGDRIMSAHMLYNINSLVVFLHYLMPTVAINAPRRAWKPTRRLGSIRFAPVSDNTRRPKRLFGSEIIFVKGG